MASEDHSTGSATKVTRIPPDSLLEKRIEFEEKLKELSIFGVKELFEKCGWMPYFEMTDSIYFGEWWEFFRHAEIREDSPQELTTVVNGTRFTVDMKDIRTATGCSRKGLQVYSDSWMKKATLKDSTLPVDEKVVKETIYVEKAHQVANPPAKLLRAKARVLHAINTQCMLHMKESRRTSVRPIDTYIIFNQLQENQINLPFLLLHYLRKCIKQFQQEVDPSKKILTHGFLITKLMKIKGVPLGVPSTLSSDIKFMDIGPFKRMVGSVQEELMKYFEEKGIPWAIKKGEKKKKVPKEKEAAEASQPVTKGRTKMICPKTKYVEKARKGKLKKMPLLDAEVIGDTSQPELVRAENVGEQAVQPKKRITKKRKATETVEEAETTSQLRKKGKKKKSAKDLPQETSEYIPPGYVPPPVPHFEKVVDETPSEGELYEKLKHDFGRLQVDQDDSTFVAESEAPSVSVQLVIERKEALQKVIDDARADREHVKALRDAEIAEMEADDNVFDGIEGLDDLDEAIPHEDLVVLHGDEIIQQEEDVLLHGAENCEDLLATQQEEEEESAHDQDLEVAREEPPNEPTSTLGIRWGRYSRWKGGYKKAPKKRSREDQLSALMRVFKCSRKEVGSSSDMLPSSSSAQHQEAEGINFDDDVDIANMILGVVQDVQHMLDVEAPIRDHDYVPELGFLQVAENEAAAPEIQTAEEEEVIHVEHMREEDMQIIPYPDWRTFPCVLREGFLHEPIYSISRFEEIDLVIHSLEFGYIDAFQVDDLGASSLTYPTFIYFHARDVYVLRSVFMSSVPHYVPIQYYYVMLQFVPQMFYENFSIPRIEWEWLPISFVPSQVWYNISRSFFLDFWLSIIPWQQELDLQHAVMIRLLGEYIRLDNEFTRIERERARVWNELRVLRLT